VLAGAERTLDHAKLLILERSSSVAAEGERLRKRGFVACAYDDRRHELLELSPADARWLQHAGLSSFHSNVLFVGRDAIGELRERVAASKAHGSR
jgi:hypothetical protein